MTIDPAFFINALFFTQKTFCFILHTTNQGFPAQTGSASAIIVKFPFADFTK